ncbi:hypothetical protein [Paraburkholderia sp. J10-1]|uniref:hypothetical protein n=1 Tax=Paraburkholderia sp. J10-1 TaxID=2805430 RepID=UPI002AB789AD|nr:hypothetical protein [Paraburkholderia sp. J10-1]
MKAFGYEIPAKVEAAILDRMRTATFLPVNIETELQRLLPADARPCAGRAHRRASRPDICRQASERLIKRERQAGSIEVIARLGRTPIFKWSGPGGEAQ